MKIDDDAKPTTVAEAIAKAEDLLANPEMLFDSRSARKTIFGLLAALQVNPSYLKAIRQNEPVFVLRGQDKFSGDTVRHWTRIVERHGVADARIQNAKSIAVRMDEWRPKKIPD